MIHRKLKLGYFVLEGLNAFATVYYFTYLFFFLQWRFGFGNLENLLMSAASGLVYALTAWLGGHFAQRFGYFTALKVGFCVMGLGLASGLVQTSSAGQVVIIVVWSLGMCFTWPTLEALASEDETRDGLTRMVGIYNLVWASSAGVASFTGGALVEWLGWASVFWLPVLLHALQLALTFWLERKYFVYHRSDKPPEPISVATGPDGAAVSHTGVADSREADRRITRLFVRMAWLANPFAYIAISTVIPLIPALAKRFELSPMYAGFFCSVWLLARLGTFGLLWRWTRWHYQFGWLLAAYGALVFSFAALFLTPLLWGIVAAQIVFGWAIGLIYYSSLFYSMDTSETKGVHGGVHESALGIGVFAGPALGAVALRLFPQQASVSTWAVSGLLLVGLAGLLWLRQNGRRR